MSSIKIQKFNLETKLDRVVLVANLHSNSIVVNDFYILISQLNIINTFINLFAIRSLFLTSEYKFEIIFSIIISLSLSETYSSANFFLITLNDYIKYKNYFVVIIDSQKNIKNVKNTLIIKCNKENKLRSKSTRKRLNANSEKIDYFF